jgi:hypothetical protein
MNNGRLTAAFYVLIGGLVGALIEGLVGTTKMWVSIGFGIAALGLFMYMFLWPSKANWKGFLLNSPRPLVGQSSINWRTERPQQIGDSFLLDMGRERLIDKIQFQRGDWSAVEYPICWAVTLQGKNMILPNWERRQYRETAFGRNINIEFERPERVRMVAIEIVEPRPNSHWAVGNIKIREIRLRLKLFRLELSWKAYIR